jgi:DNA repair protein RecO (recombination protein O)
VISALVSCEGIVLRNLRYGETSRIATLLTPELGKIGVIAKGARDPKSPFGASLEFLSHGSFVVYHRPGRDLHFLRTGAIEREFRGLFHDSGRYVLASAFAEFLERVLQGEEPAGELFDFALRGFEVLETAPGPALPELFRGMQLRVASILGYAPRLEQCLRCERPVGEPESAGVREAWSFLPGDGGVLCPECAAREPGEAGPRLSPRALRRLRAMAMGRPGGATAGHGAAVFRERPTAPDPAWIALLDALVEDFLRYHLDSYRGLRALGAFSGTGSGAAESGTKGWRGRRGGGA